MRRADIYALGCVAYYLLTGQLVFEARHTACKMMLEHAMETPVPPSERAAIAVPPALERVILACLAKEPEDRPQSALALSQWLASIAEVAWSEQDAADWWRANAGTPAIGSSSGVATEVPA